MGWSEPGPATAAPMISAVPAAAESTDSAAGEEASLLARLALSEQKLQALAHRLLTIRDEEQFRISREIHDSLGQALAVLKLDLQWMARQLPDNPPVQEKAAAMASLIDDTIRSLREIVVRLRPDILDPLGLAAALEHQARDFEAHTGIQCKLRVQAQNPDTLDAPRERDTALFRVFQECLTNVARHAHATRVQADLRAEAGKLVLDVADNGRGMAPESERRPKALGLVGMRERIAPFGGQLQILSSPTGGTLVRVSLPLTDTAADAETAPASHENTDRR